VRVIKPKTVCRPKNGGFLYRRRLPQSSVPTVEIHERLRFFRKFLRGFRTIALTRIIISRKNLDTATSANLHVNGQYVTRLRNYLKPLNLDAETTFNPDFVSTPNHTPL